MLPKVANHLLHHTARAISVAQNQTGHTIRNALQLQSSSSPSTASGNFSGWNGASSSHSNWNKRGTGSGGAKFHPGGRSYAGYTGSGRAVTQAETVSVDDLGQTVNDDSDDALSGSRPLRRLSSSAPVPPRSRTGLAVIRTVKSKSQRPFAGQSVVEPCSGTGLSPQATALLLHRLSAREVTARLYSTASGAETVSDYLDVESPATSSPSLQPSDPPYSRPHSPPSTLPTPPPEPTKETLHANLTDFNAFEKAARDKDINRVNELVQDLRSRPTPPHVSVYNAALSAMRAIRPPHQSLRSILDVYNDMLARSVAPNFKTYTNLICAFTDRDHDVHETIRRYERRGRYQTAFGGTVSPEEKKHIASLRAEHNLRSAMMLFQTACAIPYTKMPRSVYHSLLESCADNANVDAAIHVFAHLERRSDLLPSPRAFELLMSVYMSTADWRAAQDVFDEFRQACKTGRVDTDVASDGGPGQAARLVRYSCINLWSAMIEAYVRGGQHMAALGLLEQMLDTKVSDTFDPADVPPPSVVTFRRLINSFCETGEIGTALAWFDRLLLQDSSPRSPYDASVTPCRPDYPTWSTVMETLALTDRVEDLLRVMSSFQQFGVQDKIGLTKTDIHLVVQAYFRHLSLHPGLEEAKVTSIVDGFMAMVARHGSVVLAYRVNDDAQHELGRALSHLLLTRGRTGDAVRIATLYVDHEMRDISDPAAGELSERSLQRLRSLGEYVFAFSQQCFGDASQSISLQETTDVADLYWRLRMRSPAFVSAWGLQRYAAVRRSPAGLPVLPLKSWNFLIYAVAHAEEDIVAVEEALLDLRSAGVPLVDIPISTRSRLYTRLRAQKGEAYAQETMHRHNADLQHVLAYLATREANVNMGDIDDLQRSTEVSSPSPEKHKVIVDHAHSAFVSQFFPIPVARITPIVAYERFAAGRARGRYPRPEVMANLIGVLGRQREFEKVQDLYDSAQLVLQAFEEDKERQSYAWFLVEDNMILALAHGGEVNAAHVHRARIIEHGGVPSADAYGALIHNVKDTTDDAHNAVALFQEARERGVVPNIFLYNTMISKLAKARKADDALALFQEMKTTGIRPSSVTYGAVIAACCRVGDVTSAETLFAEMASKHGFKPRIPPYNTMMQLYTTTRPDRARALHYYDAMVAAGVQPSAHTYKLLLDTYGSIEPVDAAAMERAFEQVTSGRKPLVQGTHWASLIHSVGCVQKDLDRALVLFDSIVEHPSTRQSGVKLPDAVVFESLINVLAAHRRVDLIPTYVSRMKSLGIHMTAYIANLLIKAYASAGDIERAREIFEGLADPPEGIAAPHNHVPHDTQGADNSHIPVDAPVYREPSTWEAMVRAELGHCNRERAVALLERAQARKFPPAVLNRISGILLDDSVSPWAGSE